MGVNHHRARTFALKPRFGIVLEIGINRQLHIRTRLGLTAVKLAHHATCGVHLDPLAARAPAQDILKPRFDIVAPDLEIWDLQHGIRVPCCLKIIVRDRPHIAHNVREICPKRVIPRQSHIRRDPWKCGGIDRNQRELLP